MSARSTRELDLEKWKDPFGTRTVYDAAESAARTRKPKEMIDGVLAELEKCGLLIDRSHPYEMHLGSLAALFVEISSGRGLVKNPETGEPMCADLAQEISDWLSTLASDQDPPQYSPAAEDPDAQ